MRRVEKPVNRPTRSRPVSCLFCRSRKLRCSRQFPCPNCTSRGIACQLDAPLSASISTADSTPGQTDVLNSFQQDVLSRLQKLEDIVIGKSEAASRPSRQTTLQSTPSPYEQSQRRTTAVSHAGTPSTVEADWLEGEVTFPVSTSPILSYEIEFRTRSLSEVSISTPGIDYGVSGTASPTRCVWLPLREESKQIVEKYLTDITYIHHVVHIPTVRKIVDELYKKLHQNRPVQLGHVSLLLGILASTTFFWTERDMNSPLFASKEDANSQSTIWMRTTLEVLEYSRRKCSDSLEDIQALIMVGFLMCNLVGITSQARYIFSTATSVAWQLGLHRIDHPRNTDSGIPPADSVRAEIGRRIWWYLVATDWQISQFAGPQKGIYAINPLHIATRKPLNVNDENLIDGARLDSQPLDNPTSMSYCLQRIRLGELCREMSDSVPFAEIGTGNPNYAQILNIDARISEFVSAMPSFFSLDYTASDLPDTDPRSSQAIIIQRYILNSLIHAQRCRLHLPYLSKVATEPKFAYSREACLEAARLVIRTERQLASESFPFVLARLKFSGVLHCVCMATIVFLLDLCLHKGPRSGDDQERRVEILNAFSVLEQAREHSPHAEKILNSFYSVLRRHQVPLTEPGSGGAIHLASENEPSLPGPGREVALPVSSTNGMTKESDFLEPTIPAFDDIWRTFETDVDPASLVDWSTLFAELDSFMSM